MNINKEKPTIEDNILDIYQQIKFSIKGEI